jgi:hypothetical protein
MVPREATVPAHPASLGSRFAPQVYTEPRKDVVDAALSDPSKLGARKKGPEWVIPAPDFNDLTED